jgi:hypothetical protein
MGNPTHDLHIILSVYSRKDVLHYYDKVYGVKPPAGETAASLALLT